MRGPFVNAPLTTDDLEPFVDENVICGLRDYIDNYLQYVDAAGYHVAFVSYVNHRNLWQTFPDLVWTLAQKK